MVVTSCTSGRWLLKDTGMMVWKEGGAKTNVGRCLTSMGTNEKVLMAPCNDLDENQYVEFGLFDNDVLEPLCFECWKLRQENLRKKQLEEYRKIVSKTVKDIADRETSDLGDVSLRVRRAVVFYVDSKQSVTYLKWWIKSWNFIGLDQSKESFDIIVMVEIDIVQHLPIDCEEYDASFNIRLPGPGKCIYKRYTGELEFRILHRLLIF